ncbi:MAG: aminodeoxychorismate synthase component I [Gallionella sp.]
MSFYCVELPYRSDAGSYYAALADLPWAAWLDSCGMARYDIVTAAPHRTLVLDEGTGDPFALLRGLLGEPVAPIADVPFAGGALGYWGYDLARRMMTLPDIAHVTEQLPHLAVGIYDWALVLDHQQHNARLVSQQRFAETAELLPQILRRLQNKPALPADTFQVHGKITSNFTPHSYAKAFLKVQDYLQAGDCYQINLAQRFSVKAEGDAYRAYLKLRDLNPAPYSAFLNLPQVQILCNSPERFISVQGDRVVTRPIKGTRPRSSDALLDRQLADELSHHPKDRAENLMIVDLLRSDLGKSCIPGSVRAPKLFEVESFANVHHLVSTVEGKLAEGRDSLDVLCDCFPGGSVTGAPKLRAMQIIEQLEPHRRGVYCGAIGYVGFDGNMDTNIVIRSLVYANSEIRCWAGGGIVADSDVAAEYQETLDKAAGMIRLLQHYGGEYDGSTQSK